MCQTPNQLATKCFFGKHYLKQQKRKFNKIQYLLQNWEHTRVDDAYLVGEHILYKIVVCDCLLGKDSFR